MCSLVEITPKRKPRFAGPPITPVAQRRIIKVPNVINKPMSFNAMIGKSNHQTPIATDHYINTNGKGIFHVWEDSN